MQLTLEHVSYTYSPGSFFETKALNDISITIGAGSFTGIMGRTGCGKSTLALLAAGLLKPGRGKVLLDGKDVNERYSCRAELRRKTGVLFQFPEIQLFENTVEKDVAFALARSGLSKSEVSSRVRGALELVGLSYSDMRGRSPLELSAGEKRRVAIAGILVAQPELLILDEPTANLDPLSRRDFLNLAIRLHSHGTAIMMISHEADTLAEYAERIIVLEQGEIILDGDAKAVFSDAEALEKHELDVSRARRAALLLKRHGVDFPQDIFRYDDLVGALVKYAGGVP